MANMLQPDKQIYFTSGSAKALPKAETHPHPDLQLCSWHAFLCTSSFWCWGLNSGPCEQFLQAFLIQVIFQSLKLFAQAGL
jgi:hypothetical protein